MKQLIPSSSALKPIFYDTGCAFDALPYVSVPSAMTFRDTVSFICGRSMAGFHAKKLAGLSQTARCSTGMMGKLSRVCHGEGQSLIPNGIRGRNAVHSLFWTRDMCDAECDPGD